MTNQIEKDFDCLAYKQTVQLKIYSEIKKLTPAEEIAYFKQGIASSSLAKWWHSIERQSNQVVFFDSPVPASENQVEKPVPIFAEI